MATEAQTCAIGILPNRLSSPACQPIMTLIMQNKPNLPDAQMNVTSTVTKDYENARLRGRETNKPNQTQFYPVRDPKEKFSNRVKLKWFINIC